MSERMFKSSDIEEGLKPPEGMERKKLYGHLVLITARDPEEPLMEGTSYTRRQLEDIRGLVSGCSREDLEGGRFNYARMLRLEDTTI